MRLRRPVVLLVWVAACGSTRPSGVVDEGGVSLESTTSSEGSSVTSAVTSADSGSSADSHGDGEGGVDGDFPPCEGSIDLGPSYVRPKVMFVVDTSSSMLDGWDDDQDPMTPTVTRWWTARKMLGELLYEISPSKVSLGLQRAPSNAACAAATVGDPMCTDADVCLVEPVPELEIGSWWGYELTELLPIPSASSLEIVGGSPIREAYMAARDHLLDQVGESIDLIVLVTDGGASCSEPNLPQAVEIFDDELVATVAEGYEVYGIETLVVGVGVPDQPTLPAQPDSPDVDMHAALNDLAIAGGHPWNGGMQTRKYFDTAASDELLSRLERVGCGATTCTVDLGPGLDLPLFFASFNVHAYDGPGVPFVTDCESEDGWAWATEGHVVSFCGSYCDDYMACEARYEFTYGFCGE